MSSQSRSTRKQNKKLLKVGKSVENEFGVKLSSEPTKVVLLSNAGLVNGALTSSIMRVLPDSNDSQYDIVLFPDKAYCIVRCSSVAGAAMVVELLNGTSCLDFLNGQPVYAGFLDDDVPNPDLRADERPPGLIISENLLTYEDEKDWLQLCSFNKESADSCQLKNRQVEHFGYQFDYATNSVHRDTPMLDKPIPDICLKLMRTLVEKNLLTEENFPDQLTVNRYDVGAGIPFHCDTHSIFTSCIIVVSLGASVVMDFRRDQREISVHIPRRSVMLMKDDCRYGWTHGISPRKYDLLPNMGNAPVALARDVRTSFTFRRVRPNKPCDCNYRLLCDSRLKFDLDDYNASQLEKQHVHEVYDSIARHFSDTRHSQWPRVTNFLESLPQWAVVADIGCGNGKYMHVRNRPDISFIGCDRSGGLLGICQEKSFQVVQADCLELPFRQAAFDAAICIAVIHHLATFSRRKQAVQELLDLLRINGKLLIYVWALDQNLLGKSKYLKGESNTPPRRQATVLAGSTEVTLPVHTNRSTFAESDVFVPWKKTETQEMQQRYYHVFQEGELRLLIQDVKQAQILDEFYDEGNWCIILEKKLCGK